MFFELYGEAVKTALGFFWKAGWAFVLGYFISGMIQSFVPKKSLTQYMGEADFKSISLSTFFGAASSSCSFAALATARSLVLKGAHFISAVAFMFASTNLVIELGILILIFLGWEFLAAEIIGGLILITVSSIIIKLTQPREWFEKAREKVEREGSSEDFDFDWRKRITTLEGWRRVGHKFVMEWDMVWEEILIGFTVAGFMAVLVPDTLWAKVFLIDAPAWMPGWLVRVENALVGPLVAAMTFIGSMGNIPLATVLSANGVFFAGIMAFIYSDLVVPPLVAVNAEYYGKKIALYIAAVMYVSIFITALILSGTFSWLGIIPESQRVIEELTQFKIDYTFWLNLVFAGVATWLYIFHKQHVASKDEGSTVDAEDSESHSQSEGLTTKRKVAYLFIAILIGGATSYVVTGLL